MSDLLINSNGYILTVLEKILDTNIEIHGKEYLNTPNPKLFVANHFTRLEAMLLPYTIYNITQRKVGVIADDSLFSTFFGEYIKSLGAIKKSEPNRNEIILDDLTHTKKDWLIFPEGMMVKAKDIIKTDEHYSVRVNGKITKVYTGAAYFALQSQLNKQSNYLYTEDTFVIPINITYSPIVNGDNFLITLAKKIFKNQNDKFLEEIEIESNLILNSKIIIQILKPVNMREYIDKYSDIQIDNQKLIEDARYPLTYKFMRKIYENLTVRFDHIFVLILYYLEDKEICKDKFKRLFYLIANEIKENCLLYETDLTKDIINLISYEKYKPFNDVLKTAINDKIITQTKSKYIINKENLLNQHTHNTIRIKNILRVILNEVLIIDRVNDIVKEFVKKDSKTIDEQLYKLLNYERDFEFKTDRNLFWDSETLKSIDVGAPYLLENENSKKAIVLIHGFSSSPKETKELAQQLFDRGYNIVGVRLRGHGTIAEDLKSKTFRDWYNSVSKDITLATLKYDEVSIIGFSTGGLLALLSSKKLNPKIKHIICINAALKLNDIRVKTFLPALNFWNEIVESFNSDKYKKDSFVNNPKYPELNYDKYYISSLTELSKLMEYTKNKLPKINKEITIIQSKNDPIVNPKSANEIYDTIKSKSKKLIFVDSSEHIIIKGKDLDSTLEIILDKIR